MFDFTIVLVSVFEIVVSFIGSGINGNFEWKPCPSCYLWSLVYAQDVFSVFREKGVFDAETGRKLLKTLLSKGGSQDEAEQLETFLGRAPRAEAFLKSVGL